jgi:hypothetical protein
MDFLPDWVEDVVDWSKPLADDNERMGLAIELASHNVEAGTGGPFGAIAAYSSWSSRHVSRPPAASAHAIEIAPYPVHVPTSSARGAPTSRASIVSSPASSGVVAITAFGSSAVSRHALQHRVLRRMPGEVIDDLLGDLGLDERLADRAGYAAA